MLKMVGNVIENFMRLNNRHEQIWLMVLRLHNIPTMLAPKEYVMGLEQGRWCKFYRVNGHHTEDYY